MDVGRLIAVTWLPLRQRGSSPGAEQLLKLRALRGSQAPNQVRESQQQMVHASAWPVGANRGANRRRSARNPLLLRRF